MTLHEFFYPPFDFRLSRSIRRWRIAWLIVTLLNILLLIVALIAGKSPFVFVAGIVLPALAQWRSVALQAGLKR